MGTPPSSRPVTYALLAATCVPLLWRRRYPCTSAVVAYVAFMAVSMMMPMVGGQLILLVAFFLSMYSAAAWAPNRPGMLVTIGVVAGTIIFWLIWSLAVGAGAERLRGELNTLDPGNALISPLVAYLLFNLLINGAFLAGALIFGVSSWRRARGNAEIVAQQAQLTAQADQLRDEAVLRERLRIARDLHDVVGHHV
ncbi:histidine kinase, partial [Propionibacterium freudenreichii]|nr:histidine kinase [Propionibacterium freudenreichii]